MQRSAVQRNARQYNAIQCKACVYVCVCEYVYSMYVCNCVCMYECMYACTHVMYVMYVTIIMLRNECTGLHCNVMQCMQRNVRQCIVMSVCMRTFITALYVLFLGRFGAFSCLSYSSHIPPTPICPGNVLA